MLLPAKMPSLVKMLYQNYTWDFHAESKRSSDKVMYLTFDDGPVPEATEFVLDELDKFNAKATFFCIGNNVEKNPAIFQRLTDDGHAIGNHTQHHIEGWKTNTNDYIQNIMDAEKLIENQNTQKLFRPPYGRIRRKQGRKLRSLGFNVIMWDVVAKDWRNDVSKEECLVNVIDNATNGSIVVMHDSLKALDNVTYALPRILRHFSNKGFQFNKIESFNNQARYTPV